MNCNCFQKSARRRGTARDVAGTNRDDAIVTCTIHRRRVGASIIADAAPNGIGVFASRVTSAFVPARRASFRDRARAAGRAYAAFAPSARSAARGTRSIFTGSSARARSPTRAFAPSARSTARRMRSIFTGSSTYPSPRVNFRVHEFAGDRDLERAGRRRRRRRGDGGARKFRRDGALDRRREAQVASAASVRDVHERIHDDERRESRSGDEVDASSRGARPARTSEYGCSRAMC